MVQVENLKVLERVSGKLEFGRSDLRGRVMKLAVFFTLFSECVLLFELLTTVKQPLDELNNSSHWEEKLHEGKRISQRNLN